VRGIPITDYCDEHKLAIRQRLELFVQVCQAVQHAHQKGVIHRDLKPSNVLVAHDDTVPLPKIIDFGIAKATSQPLTERTLFTALAQVVGTPLYMSPEQAALNHLDVDTRSDVYSLGVLLYELLTGTTPFEQERLRQAGLDAVRRIIREDRSRGAAELIDTLSAPAFSSVRISSIVRIPPPTHSGMNTTSAVRRTTSIMIPRLSWLAVISRNTSSSAPSRSYRSATSTGSPASRSWTKFVPLTTRPRSTSRHGMIRLASTAGSSLNCPHKPEALARADPRFLANASG